MNKLLLPLWIFAALVLLLYSFTQVDLSLTLSQVSIWQGIQKSFQEIGYFNRPLSGLLYLLIIAIMFGLYALTLWAATQKKITRGLLVKIIIGVSAILFFAYNAFSYDLFNYIFDAKIVTFYQENPYERRALDYPEDPMLSFMHWTHRTYPYGPVWLGITVPLSYIGFNYFIITFYLFKLLMFGSFIISVFLVERIATRFGVNSLFAVAAFALNPLVLIESLVAAHNDIVMIMFSLLAILFFSEKRYIKSFVALLLSILLKFATVFVIPAIILRGKFNVSSNVFFYVLTLCGVIAAILAASRTNFQPWYLLYVIPFAAFVAKKYFVLIPLFFISAAGLLQYFPYLFTGSWEKPIPDILNYIMLGSIIISTLLIGVRFLQSKVQA